MKTIVTVSLAAAFAAAGLAAAAPADAAYTAKVGGGTLKITGNGAGDKLALRLQKGNRNELVVDVKANGSADFSFDRSTFRRIVVNAGGGNDTVSIVEKNGAFTNKEKTTLNGGLGQDRLVGGRFGETFAGGRGDDKISGRKGGDRILWTAGEGADTIDGEQGSDMLIADGSAGGDTFVIAPVGARVSLSSGSGALNIGKVERDRRERPRLERRPPGPARPGRTHRPHADRRLSERHRRRRRLERLGERRRRGRHRDRRRRATTRCSGRTVTTPT